MPTFIVNNEIIYCANRSMQPAISLEDNSGCTCTSL